MYRGPGHRAHLLSPPGFRSKGIPAPFRPYDIVTHAFSRVAKAAGFQGVRLHDLRHTHASLMLQADVHPKILGERLGPASIAITMDIYSHVLLGLQKEVANRFSSLQAPPDEGR